MLTRTATVLGFVAAASAYANPAHVAAKLQARQTGTSGGDLTACVSALAEFATIVPTPPPEVLSWFIANPITDPCDFTNIPASLTSAASSYQSVAISFLSAESSKLASIVSVCPDASSALDAVEQATLTCKAGGGATTTPTAGAGSGSGSGSGSGTTPAAGASSSTTKPASGAGASTAGAARETGFVGAAIAAVGFLGVVAAL